MLIVEALRYAQIPEQQPWFFLGKMTILGPPKPVRDTRYENDPQPHFPPTDGSDKVQELSGDNLLVHSRTIYRPDRPDPVQCLHHRYQPCPIDYLPLKYKNKG